MFTTLINLMTSDISTQQLKPYIFLTGQICASTNSGAIAKYAAFNPYLRHYC